MMKKLILAITMKRSFTVGLWLMLLAAMPTQAQLTGLMLEKDCGSEYGSAGYLGCMAYFAGWAGGSAVWRGISKAAEQQPHPMMPCTDDVNREVMVRVWLKHIEENPEELQKPPHWSILSAMIESFPCKVGGGE